MTQTPSAKPQKKRDPRLTMLLDRHAQSDQEQYSDLF